MNLPHPRWKMDITFGHVLQLVGMVIIAIAFVYSIKSEIDLVRVQVELVKTQLDAKISANELRIANFDKNIGREIVIIRESLQDMRREIAEERQINRTIKPIETPK